MIGVNALLLKTYLIAIDPCGWFLYINAIYAALMIFLRFFRFKKQGLHYYLFDFCYWANYLVFISAIFFPNNPHLFNVSYFYGVGVLSWAILTFRNSLIFHSIDHMTSLYIHSQPMAVMTLLRWSNADNCPNIQFFSPIYSLHYIIAFYTTWAIIYYIINFKLLWDRINRNHYEVLYLYVEKQKKSVSARLMNCMGGKYKAPLFMLTHIILTVISGIFAIIQFQFQTANYLGVFLILSVALWNGSNYYFEYFSKKYERSLEAIEKLQAQAIIVEQL